MIILGMSCIQSFAQSGEAVHKDSTAKPVAKKDSTGFDRFNAKAEHLFKILPVPIYSYSPEAGNIYGLAKFNVINLNKKDTISKASKLSEVFTASSLHQVNASISTQLVIRRRQIYNHQLRQLQKGARVYMGHRQYHYQRP